MVNFVTGLLIGSMIGCVLGIVVMALCRASKDSKEGNCYEKDNRK